jgi:tRNA pseudouridine55 synthase
VLVVDKPEGVTSHDVVAIARRSLGETRIGHTGTLDPLATGVLPLACGRATRLVRFLSATDKDYEATVRFGITTDTYDITGAETGRCDREPARQTVEDAIARLTGEYAQVPPAFSAKKVDGQRAYARARAQQAVELKPVPVRVSRAELVGWTDGSAVIALTCSAGFYVRSFAHELGAMAGTGACLAALRRTRSGDFRLTQSVTLQMIRDDAAACAARIIPLRALLPGFPAVRLTPRGRERAAHGQRLRPDDVEHVEPAGGVARPASGWSAAGGPWVRLVDRDGELVAMGTAGDDADALHPCVVLI